jgi:hypothetical protein
MPGELDAGVYSRQSMPMPWTAKPGAELALESTEIHLVN